MDELDNLLRKNLMKDSLETQYIENNQTAFQLCPQPKQNRNSKLY